MTKSPAKIQLLLIACAAVVFFAVVAFFSSKTASRIHEPGMIFKPNSPVAGATTRMVIDHFNEAFNRHDADAVAALLTDDTVFEDTSAAPDGRRIEGKAAVVAFWRTWFTQNADAVFEEEDVIISGDRAVVRWVYRKLRNGQPWHLHGVDVFTDRDGKVAAKL